MWHIPFSMTSCQCIDSKRSPARTCGRFLRWRWARQKKAWRARRSPQRALTVGHVVVQSHSLTLCLARQTPGGSRSERASERASRLAAFEMFSSVLQLCVHRPLLPG